MASTFFDIRTGIEDLFVKEEAGAIKTTTPGRPSVGTMLCFILMEAAGILAIFVPEKLKKKLPLLGIPVVVLGGTAILGYVMNKPVLYYTIAKFSTAMAFHTAILFVMLGTGLTLIGKAKVYN